MRRFGPALVLCLLPSIAAAQVVQPLQVLSRFTPSPANPNGPLVEVPGGDFYGVTTSAIVRLTPAGQVTEVAHFTDLLPGGALVLASDGGLYGTTSLRSSSLAPGGTIFRFDPVTGVVRTVHTFSSSSEGRLPLGGLVAAGGSLYGVTRFGPGTTNAAGTLFHVVVATGEVVTDAVFPGYTQGFTRPAGPLTLGPDGLLYGTTDDESANGSGVPSVLYRVDPASRVVTPLRAFSSADGTSPGPLRLAPDGSLYGSARSGGLEDAGTIFRYTPGTGLFQRVYSLAPSNGVDGRGPGPLVVGPDGHLYGMTQRANSGLATSWALFRLRAGGGSFTYERLLELDDTVAGRPTGITLTRGADGLLYGYAQVGGPTFAGLTVTPGLPAPPPGTGSLFRFDPAEGGPPSNPTSFTLLTTFPLLTTWNPSAPMPATDGFLYGLTSAGRPANRGAAYRLDPATGSVTILGDVPGPITSRALNSSLTPGPDGAFYAIADTFAPSPVEHRILRLDPATGTVTVAVASGAPSDLTRTPAGVLYGVDRNRTPQAIVRFDPMANTLTALTTGAMTFSPLTATADGQVFAVAQTAVPLPPTSTFLTRTSLVRLNPAAPDGVDSVVLGDDILAVDRLVEGAGGVLYLGLTRGTFSGHAMVAVHRTTGALQPVCALPPVNGGPRQISLGADGALYGVIGTSRQRLFRCDPASGAVAVSALPPDVNTVVGPLRATFSGFLYGAAAGAFDSQGGIVFRLPAGAALPALDSDGDGLPNQWETAYGLDPFTAGAGSGAADDPDGDGRTNAQELADGTHPRGFVTRLFAEGATGPFFRTRFDLTAPGEAGANVRIRFLTDAGAVVAADLIVPAFSHRDLDPSTLPGLASASFSTIVESDVPIAVDRTMTWDATGYGSTLETAIAAPSTTWYFAEGSTSGEFALFYLLQNPQAVAVTATVTYLLPLGQPAIVRTYTLPPASRTTIVVDADPALANTDLSATISATAPIVAERAMYLSRPGQPFMAGHESAGVTGPALEWFFAEGATGDFFDLFILLANPGATAATVEVEYLRTSGAPLTKTYTVPAQSRRTIWVDDEELPAGSGQKPLAGTSLSTVVRSTNAVPIIAERSMWWPGPAITSNFWYEAHNSPGATATSTRWVLGGAEIGGPDNAETYVLIANATATPSTVRVSVRPDDALGLTEIYTIPARSRVTVSLRVLGAGVPDGRYGVDVESMDGVPLIVERATYASPGGVLWGRGGNALAAPLP